MPGSSKKKNRRAHGEGTYKTAPNGKIRLVKRIEGKWLAGPLANSKQEALAAFNRKYPNGAKDATASLSFTSLAKRWLAEREQKLAPSAVKSYTCWINAVAKDPLGAMPVGSIKQHHLRQWFARQSLAPTTARKRLGFICQILRLAGNEHSYTPPAADRHARRPLSAAERLAVKTEAVQSTDHVERVGVLLCLEMGLRVSEACGLKHEDFQNGGVWIKRSVTRTAGALNVREKTKTARSARWVPVPPSLEKDVGPPRSGYVLTGSDRPGYPDVLQNAAKRVFARAGIKGIPHLGPHTLRRTYGMTLLEAGTDVVTSAELMGHDPKMLLDEYTRSRIDLKRKAVENAFANNNHSPQLGQNLGQNPLV